MAKLVDSMPKSYWEDRNWAYEHINELAIKYPNQWVAIFQKRVVATGESSVEVEKLAEKRSGRADNPLIFVEKGCHIYENRLTIH